MINLDIMSAEALELTRKKITEELERRHNEHLPTVRAEICKTIRLNGYTLDEVFPINMIEDVAFHQVNLCTGDLDL